MSKCKSERLGERVHRPRRLANFVATSPYEMVLSRTERMTAQAQCSANRSRECTHVLEGLEAAMREGVHQIRSPRRMHGHRQLVPPPVRTAAPCTTPAKQ